MEFQIIRKNPRNAFSTTKGNNYSLAVREKITIKDGNAARLLQLLKQEEDIMWILTPFAKIKGLALR